MEKKKLLIACAPQVMVFRAAEMLSVRECNTAYTIITRENRVDESRDRLPGWEIITYAGEYLNPWTLSDETLQACRAAARDGVFFVCNSDNCNGYLNINILAHTFSRSVAAVTPSMKLIIPRLPETLQEMISRNDMEKIRSYVESTPEYIHMKHDIASAVRSPTTMVGPRHVHLSVSTACNYKCVMCAFHSPRNKPGEISPDFQMPPGYKRAEDLKKVVMNFDVFKTVVDDLRDVGGGTIVFTGFGEPLLNPHICEMMQYVADKNLVANVVTNGRLMDVEIRDTIGRTEVRVVHISLNSASPATYARIHTNMPEEGFDIVVSNIAGLVEEKKKCGIGPDIGISFVLSSINIHEIGDMLKLGSELGVDYIALVPVFVFPEIRDLLLESGDIEQVRTEVRAFEKANDSRPRINVDFSMWNPEPLSTKNFHSKAPCYIGWTFTQITSWGDVRPCCSCSSVMGNVLEEPFAKIWNNEKYIEMRKKMADLPTRRNPIANCGCYSCGHIRENSNIHYEVTGQRIENV